MSSHTSNQNVSTILRDLLESIYSIAHCLNLHLLDAQPRQDMLGAIEALSSLWEQLRQTPKDNALFASLDHRLLKTVSEVCIVARTCSTLEAGLLSRTVRRLATGLRETYEQLTQVEQPTVVPIEVLTEETEIPTPLEKAAESLPEAPPTLVAQTEESLIPPEAESAEEPTVQAETTLEQEKIAAAREQVTLEQEEAVALPPEQIETAGEAVTLPEEILPIAEEAGEVLDLARTVTEPEMEVDPYALLSENLDRIGAMLDEVENHPLPEEEALALLMSCAYRYRWLRSRAVHWEREWEVAQLKEQLVRLGREHHVWMPPLQSNIEFSDHELGTLQQAYDALVQSWIMWKWYQQHRGDLDKSSAVPMLESITAPVPMIQQIYSSREISCPEDGTEQLRQSVLLEAQTRKWKIETLASNCSRQKQLNCLKKAGEHWDLAKKQVEKKTKQREALQVLEQILSNPHPDTFEEDLLCALVDCHRVQVPYSNLELRRIINGYDYLLENPAVPERCGLSQSECNTARRFLVNLGKRLLEDRLQDKEETPPEEEAEEEHNGELLRKARRITKGKKVLMVCFNRRAEAEQRIKEELGFSEVDWPDLDGGESIDSLESRIRNADMTIVVVRYSRTHWKNAKEVVERYNKQFVMAPKGYGVTHLAEQIVKQCHAG